jgi:DNA invertase Pin-like site-specific DNA recombinase
MTTAIRRLALYARVSIQDQAPDNQLLELRRNAARGWRAVRDHGLSGAKDRRPVLDELTAAVRRHQVDAS